MGVMATTRVAEHAANRAGPADSSQTGAPDPHGQDEALGSPTVSPGRWPDPNTIHTRWTAADLEILPDDGLRYEIIDGTLVVSPAPRPIHQVVSANLYDALRPAIPPAFKLLFAPVDWRPNEAHSLQPDLILAPAGALGGRAIEALPLLVVEILSPSSRTLDRVTKFHVYAQAGVPQYWIVDPGSETREPSVEVYDLADGEYRLQAKAQGAQQVSITGSVSVTVTPSDLVR